jgi:hypothetical protein
MGKLSEKLLADAKRNPQKTFQVLIVLNDETDAETLPISNFKKYMGNILAATLTGKEVVVLSGMKTVQSIELDGEVNAL